MKFQKYDWFSFMYKPFQNQKLKKEKTICFYYHLILIKRHLLLYFLFSSSISNMHHLCIFSGLYGIYKTVTSIWWNCVIPGMLTTSWMWKSCLQCPGWKMHIPHQPTYASPCCLLAFPWVNVSSGCWMSTLVPSGSSTRIGKEFMLHSFEQLIQCRS